MFDDWNRLNLTARDFELIESALHTQRKILSVQNEAGGTGAGQKLSELTRLINRVTRARPAPRSQVASSWMQSLRGLFFVQEKCSHCR